MARYRAKQINEIEAEQFLPPHQIPKGVSDVYELSDGVFSGRVWTIQGQRVSVNAGEWIVEESNNSDCHYPIDDTVFREKYELVDKPNLNE
jgi:hypothetical protein